jgi:hypothetical protein
MRVLGLAAGAAITFGFVGQVYALSFSTPVGDDDVKFVLNNTFTAGGGIRMQSPSVNLIGKSNLDRNVCGVPYNSCQGVFKTQIYPAQHLVNAPGAASVNGDDGDLNYGKGDLFQAPAKITQDLNVTYKDFGFFARTLYFYDFVNNDFTENHPNRITAQNVNDPDVGIPSGSTTASIPYPGTKVFGPGKLVTNKRTDGESLSQAGTDLQYLDSYFYGKLPIPFTDGKELTFKLGRQTVNWGESTLLVINSLNQANPVNANNFTRIGSQVEEVFTPINMAFASFEPFENATLEGFYQLEWKNVESSTPGTYFSSLDVGTNNIGKTVAASFGGGAEDPDSVASLQYNPLARITNTTLTLQRLPDREPKTDGQFGVSFKYYAENLNNGTEIGLYAMNYHSRLPYASFISANASCARREGNALGIDANSTETFALACPDIPQVQGLTGNVADSTSSAAALSSAKFLLEYPENIHLFGVSFNTTAGDYSLQGEVAYRPNLPLQVDLHDLAFAAFGPTLTRCHEASLGCEGTAVGVGDVVNGVPQTYGSSDFTNADGSRGAYNDTFSLVVGHLPGSARAFPNYIIPFRGGVVGENPPNSYIQGYEREQVYQFNLGATRVLGATDNPIGADQILILGEAGAVYAPFLPPLDKLQFQASGVQYNASAGADGSGFTLRDPSQPASTTNPYVPVGGRAMACSTDPDCSYGPDGLRFNPHQQDPTGYPDKFSWGYRLITQIRYESILPSISVQPTIILAHDVQGTSPLVGDVFVAGRKSVNTLIETRYRSAFSVSVGYSWFWGGGVYNTLSDRDFAQFFIKYQF